VVARPQNLRRRSRRTFDPGSALTLVIRYLVYLSQDIVSYHSSRVCLYLAIPRRYFRVGEWVKPEFKRYIAEKKYIVYW